MVNEIEINGIKYRQREQANKVPKSKAMTSILMTASMFALLDPYAKKPKETPKVDIIKEYALIQQKKSMLSKSQRDWVCFKFNRNFEVIN